MEEALRQIAEHLRAGEDISPKQLDRILRQQSRKLADPSQRLSKRALMGWYREERAQRTAFWESLRLDKAQDDALIRLLRAKPRRTASGVATVTVLTKPWPCGADCLYCPNDVRMPKSYLADEPACQRAERCSFDPYLQVAARLGVLASMGHNTDKVELIVLGGTWLDYPEAYRLWFISQLFQALDDFGTARLSTEAERRSGFYESWPKATDALLAAIQSQVDRGERSYHEALKSLPSFPEAEQLGDEVSWERLESLQKTNETAQARCVGLVVETRPDTITSVALTELRRLGVTKVQLGIQSLDEAVLAQNCRMGSVQDVEQALALLRLFGFKSHVHMMANLLGGSPEEDLEQYRRLVEDERYLPDEVKLYPCALVESAHLTKAFEAGAWQPYGEEELVSLLAACVRLTPVHTRISRMIRDIPSQDILTGCKKTNLRQIVEGAVNAQPPEEPVREMRLREVATDALDEATLRLEEVPYETSNTQEVFLQWVDGKGALAAFLRLSLPQEAAPWGSHAAMIREVHVYGRASRIHESEEGNQHLGLGRQLVERASALAKAAGYEDILVISAVGTRAYYRNLGFEDAGLYQKRRL